MILFQMECFTRVKWGSNQSYRGHFGIISNYSGLWAFLWQSTTIYLKKSIFMIYVLWFLHFVEVIPDFWPHGHLILLPLVSGVWTISWIIYWPHWVNIWFTLAFVLPSIWLRKLDTFLADGRSAPFLFELFQILWLF